MNEIHHISQFHSQHSSGERKPSYLCSVSIEVSGQKKVNVITARYEQHSKQYNKRILPITDIQRKIEKYGKT